MAACICRRKFIKILLLLDSLEDEEPIERKRDLWTRAWIKRRSERGAYAQIIQELAIEDDAAYTQYFRMNREKFEYILCRIEQTIARKDTVMRISISARERLCITLRYLATGETFSSLETQFRVSRTAISYIVVEVCNAIYSVLGPTLIQVPKKEEEWLEISRLFETRWNFPNGLFAVDGKRVLLQQPKNSGSHYYDYKGHNSILAMVAVGPEYEIVAADVGMNGRMSDGGNWSRNAFRMMLVNPDNPLNIPSPRSLPGRTKKVPFVGVGDNAFPLTSYMMKPYPSSNLTTEKRIYNYRLSRMRRISENVLGIMAQKWRVLRNAMLVGPEKATTIVLAIMTLHNFLRHDLMLCGNQGEDQTIDQQQPLNSWLDLPSLSTGQNYTENAKEIRKEFEDYFNMEGAVIWQWTAARIDQ